MKKRYILLQESRDSTPTDIIYLQVFDDLFHTVDEAVEFSNKFCTDGVTSLLVEVVGKSSAKVVKI